MSEQLALVERSRAQAKVGTESNSRGKTKTRGRFKAGATHTSKRDDKKSAQIRERSDCRRELERLWEEGSYQALAKVRRQEIK